MDAPQPLDHEEQAVQDLVLVINRAGLIENILNQIISDYCAPRKEAWVFMWSVVLDTSVMALGAKLKVVMAIAQEMKVKLPKDALNKVVQLRNSFAHHTTDAHVVYAVGKTPEEDKIYHQFWTLDGNGVLKKSKRHEAFESFNENYQIAKKALAELKDLLREQVAAKDHLIQQGEPLAPRTSYYDNNYTVDNRLSVTYTIESA